MDVHLDPLGGIAGDMFVAAILDAFPEHEARVQEHVRACGAGLALQVGSVAHHDGVLSGRRFDVALADEPHHDHDDDHDHHHHHAHWRLIRAQLEGSSLPRAVIEHAVAIFTLLAEAEARVHAVPVDEVAFHEVGAWDSIADIVAAASLIDALGAERWTTSPLPTGSGRIHTAHGLMPVPAPATALLLDGFSTIDDGIPGERVTPTGAAILRHLCEGQPAARAPRRLGRTGIGFGTRKLDGVSNCLRVLCFEEAAGGAKGHRELLQVEFDVDDQSAEELAIGLDRLRRHEAVFEVVQLPVFGKKGRMATQVRILARHDAIEAVAAACFAETTTIGLRYQTLNGIALPRHQTEVEVEGVKVRVKMVDRAEGPTAKAEADDAVSAEGQVKRRRLRTEAELAALTQSWGWRR